MLACMGGCVWRVSRVSVCIWCMCVRIACRPATSMLIGDWCNVRAVLPSSNVFNADLKPPLLCCVVGDLSHQLTFSPTQRSAWCSLAHVESCLPIAHALVVTGGGCSDPAHWRQALQPVEICSELSCLCRVCDACCSTLLLNCS
jgi:hypothetical protein